MSHYETAEQREIRRLMSEISRQEEGRRQTERELRRAMEMRTQAESHLNRMMHEFRREIQNNRHDLNAGLRDLNRQLKEKERIQAEKISAMQQAHARELHAMEDLLNQEHAAMQAQAAETRRELQTGLAELRTETDRKLKSQADNFKNAIEAAERETRAEIRVVEQRVYQIEKELSNQKESDRELAQFWFERAEIVYTQIRKTAHPQLLQEFDLTALEHARELYVQDFQSGRYALAINDGRQAYYLVGDIRERLMKEELSWNSQYNKVMARHTAFISSFDEAQRRIYHVPINGETLVDDNGIDYWSFGRLGTLGERYKKIEEALASSDKMTVQQLTDTEEKLRRLQEDLIKIENTAHTNVAMSYARADIAQKVAGIVSTDFAMTEASGDFFSTEPREEYHGVFTNTITGAQAGIVITPLLDEDGVMSNHVELILGNVNNDPVTRERMAKAVAESLRKSGALDGASFPCIHKYGDKSADEILRVGDIDAVERGDESARSSVRQEQRDASPVRQVTRHAKDSAPHTTYSSRT